MSRFSSKRHPARDTRIAANGREIRENFRDWMGGSVVRQVVYHATSQDFDEFDTEKSDLGAHFGSLEQVDNAALRTRLETQGAMSVMPVWLKLRRPLRLKDVGSFHADGIAPQLERKGLLGRGEGKRIQKEIDQDWRLRKHYDPLMIEAISRAGFDGVVYKNEHEASGDSYIVFDPRCIKSAIGNSGLYLSDSASLTDTEASHRLELALKARHVASPVAARPRKPRP